MCKKEMEVFPDMTPIHTITPTADVNAVYEQMDELTQKEIERLITLARKVKNGEIDSIWTERSHKGNVLRITPYKSAA